MFDNLIIKPIKIIIDTVFSVMLCGTVRIMLVPIELLIQFPLFFISETIKCMNYFNGMRWGSGKCEADNTWAITSYMMYVYGNVSFVLNNTIDNLYISFGLKEDIKKDITPKEPDDSKISPINYEVFFEENSIVTECIEDQLGMTLNTASFRELV